VNEEISNWLTSNRDYQEGVLLYKKHGKNATLTALFMSGSNSYTRGKLVAELTAINEIVAAPKKVEKNINPIPPNTDKNNWPEIVRQWHQEYVMCLKQMSELHSRLYRATSDKARYKLALAIDELDIKADVLLADVNYYRDNGVVPDKDGYNVDAMTPTELAMARKNIPSYIAKLNTKLKANGIDEERIADLLFRKAEWEKLLNRVINKINAF
jgi:hypothetical protein